MSARSSFLLTIIAGVSFLTIAATSSMVLVASDLQAQCAGHRGLEGHLACIKTRFKDFSLPCQRAAIKAAAVAGACRADVKKNCADIKPGGGRIEDCVKDHLADMSDACKERIISQAADKN